MRDPIGVRLSDVTVRFQTRGAAELEVLSGVSLNCAPGELLSIVGPSGCGKSTLLRLVAGLQHPTQGSLTFFQSANQPARVRPTMGFVFQTANLLPWRNVDGNIGLPLELAGSSQAARREAVSRARQLIGLAAEDIEKLPRQLSGGMQMRVSLARALVTDPQIMLLDEPFAALDDILRHQLNDELSGLRSSQRWTTLFVTHNVAEAVYLADRVLVLGKTTPGRRSPHAMISMPWVGKRPAELRDELDYMQECRRVHDLLRRFSL
jgi:NitT/TauT family transport system ATP-binding protein